MIKDARISAIIELVPNFELIRSNLPSGMCLSCDKNIFLKLQKGLTVPTPKIFWNELAQHVGVKKDLLTENCQCEICRVILILLLFFDEIESIVVKSIVYFHRLQDLDSKETRILCMIFQDG